MAAGPLKLLPMTGEVPLDWGDIWHYHLSADRVKTPEERIALKELSDAYAEGKYEGIDPLSIPPYAREKESGDGHS